MFKNMKYFLYLQLLLNVCLVLTLSISEEQDIDIDVEPNQYTEENNVQNHRDKKLLFTIVKITPQECTTVESVPSIGTCMSRTDCNSVGGNSSGSCARGFGVCCKVVRTCSSNTEHNNTHFMNPNYPAPDTGYGACTLTINRVQEDICQMRFDFMDLQLSQPDFNGICNIDFLTVTGGSVAAPTICGDNGGQHLYVDLDPNGGAVRLSVDRTAGSMATRKWNVKVTQISCSSSNKAPSGCVQYFTETSGTVQSFNFAQTLPSGDAAIEETRQLANLDYGVCMKAASGYCGITWTRNITGGDYGFTVSHTVNAIAPGLIGKPDAAATDAADCPSDYVIIPGGTQDTGVQADRFCGLGFPNSVSTTSLPFTLFVKTNENEDTDTLNRGFNLDYRQTIC